MELDDKFTRRARPTVVYGGIALAPLNYTVLPMVGNLLGVDFTGFDIPPEFWYSWATISGIYAGGRSLEKKGHQSSLLEKVMGGPNPHGEED